MFEQSHLLFFRHDTPVTPSNLSQYIDLNQVTEKADWCMSFFNGSFCLNGYFYSAPPVPVTDYARQNLFYIKAFSLMYSKSGYSTRRANEHSYLLLFTYDGQGFLEYEGKTYTLSKGEGFLIDCRRPHFYKSMDSHWTHADLHFNGYLSDDFFGIFKGNNCLTFRQFCDGSFQEHLEDLVELYTGILPYREMLISQKLHAILTMLLTSASFYRESAEKIPENLGWLLKYMQNSYHRHLTLDALSEFSGISKPHLIRLFHKYVGCTPREYLIQLQIEHARQLLETTDLTVRQIGIMVGVEESNYFSRLFKLKTGMSPTEWRNAHRTCSFDVPAHS